MKWKQLTLGPIQTNGYILFDEKNRQAIVIDPGADGDRIIQTIDAVDTQPLAILLTHAHFDHIGAVDQLREKYRIPVYLHEQEADWLTDPEKNGSAFFPVDRVTQKPADHLFKEERELEIGTFHLHVFRTPGHSPGSVSYYSRNDGIVFAGDTLFAGSIGRTDLPGGDHDVLLNSIASKLLTLPEETIVAPGHGPVTRIGNEAESNPFLQQI